MQNTVLWAGVLYCVLLPLRPRRRGGEGRRAAPSGPRDFARPVRDPDPYVLRLPHPRDARRLRWFERVRATGRPVAHTSEETCRQRESGVSGDDVVRPYVRQAIGETWRPGGWELPDE